jgi:drug/metabolite transporter (DMT)-like permease
MVTHLYLLAVQFIFAAFPVVSKIAFREVSPWALAWIRMAIAAAILLAWFYGFRRERIEPADFRKLFLLSVFGVSLNQLCYLRGLSLTTAINATILVGMIPVFTFLVALFLRRETTTFAKSGGVFLGFSGVFVLAGPGSVSFGSQYTFGNVLLLTGAFSYAVFLVLGRNIMSRYHPMTVVTWIFAFGSITMLPFAWTELREANVLSFGILTWASIAFLTLFASILAYFLVGLALKKASATLVAVYICMQPVLVAFLAVPILGESITWMTVVSGMLIFSGVVLSASHRPSETVEG